MTARTIALGRRMNLFTIHLVLQLLVADQTEVWALRFQEFAKPGLVRIMAGGALIRNHRGMLTLVLSHGLHEVIMTHGAEAALLVAGHACEVAAMGVVAGQAFPITEGYMGVFFAHLFNKSAMAANAEFCAGFLEELFILAAVWIMAGLTLAVAHRTVGVACAEFLPFFHVTGVADHIHPLVEHIWKVGAVGVMTG